MYHDQSFDTDLPGCFKRIFEIISGATCIECNVKLRPRAVAWCSSDGSGGEPRTSWLQSIPTCDNLDLVSLRISKRFPINVAWSVVMPVRLPPGRDKLATNPSPTGSETPKKTTGIVRVAFFAAIAAAPEDVMITSGLILTSSAAIAV